MLRIITCVSRKFNENFDCSQLFLNGPDLNTLRNFGVLRQSNYLNCEETISTHSEYKAGQYNALQRPLTALPQKQTKKACKKRSKEKRGKSVLRENSFCIIMVIGIYLVPKNSIYIMKYCNRVLYTCRSTSRPTPG